MNDLLRNIYSHIFWFSLIITICISIWLRAFTIIDWFVFSDLSSNLYYSYSNDFWSPYSLIIRFEKHSFLEGSLYVALYR